MLFKKIALRMNILRLLRLKDKMLDNRSCLKLTKCQIGLLKFTQDSSCTKVQ